MPRWPTLNFQMKNTVFNEWTCWIRPTEKAPQGKGYNLPICVGPKFILQYWKEVKRKDWGLEDTLIEGIKRKTGEGTGERAASRKL